MIDRIQHIGYLTPDLDAAVDWFERSFGAKNSGGGKVPESYPVPSGGRNAYVRFGRGEAELIEPADKRGLPGGGLTMHHVGYLVSDIEQVASTLRGRGLKFAGDAPGTNVMGHQVFYLDASTSNGVMVHLTQVPGQPDDSGAGQGLEIERIVHAGYLVPNLEQAIAWYVEGLDGQHVGGGATPTGGRAAFVNFGGAQVELIEPADPGRPAGSGHSMDHVGYAVGDILACSGQCQARGLKMAAAAPVTNPIGQQVLYLDTATSMGSRMHLTQPPA